MNRIVKVRLTRMLRSVDEEFVKGVAQYVRAPNEAKLLNTNEGWSVRTIDNLGRLVALCYKGVEVRLFFKVQTTDLQTDVNAPPPLGLVEHEHQNWMAIDLLGLSQKQEAGADVSNLLAEIRALKGSEKSLREEKQTLMQKVVELVEQNGKYEEAMAAATQAFEETKKSIKEGLRKRLTIEMERELDAHYLNAFNVVRSAWKAREHDTVFAALWRQGKAATEATGCQIIEPQPGELFDPQQHNASDTEPTTNKEKDGTVARVTDVGLARQGRVLRPADVAVFVVREDATACQTDKKTLDTL